MDDEYMDKVYDNHKAVRAAQREAEGRCGTCGAFNGPTHLCPNVTLLPRPMAWWARKIASEREQQRGEQR